MAPTTVANSSLPVVASNSSQSLIEELDARQEEVLAKLEELNQRLELVLRQCAPLAQAEAA